MQHRIYKNTPLAILKYICARREPTLLQFYSHVQHTVIRGRAEDGWRVMLLRRWESQRSVTQLNALWHPKLWQVRSSGCSIKYVPHFYVSVFEPAIILTILRVFVWKVRSLRIHVKFNLMCNDSEGRFCSNVSLKNLSKFPNFTTMFHIIGLSRFSYSRN